MVEIGKYNSLEVIKSVDFGIYLDGDDFGNILVPKRYVDPSIRVGDVINVFIYLDSEDRIIGTTEIPKAQVGEFAGLKVVAVNNAGAFLDWGLSKDLLLPYREQRNKVKEGDTCVVYVFLDELTSRPVATMKTGKYLSEDFPEYKHFEEVSVLIEAQTDLGYKCIVDQKFSGIIYHNMTLKPLAIGETITAYIDHVRPDRKIDLIMERPGFEKVESVEDKILEFMKENQGKMPYTDKSDPEKIREVFGTSKKTFKKALGDLYKQKLIRIGPNQIELV